MSEPRRPSAGEGEGEERLGIEMVEQLTVEKKS